MGCSTAVMYVKFCNGTTVTCDGLSQWGSQRLAEQGLNSFEILTNYYGNDIELVADAPVQEGRDSYPGQPVRLGDIGESVFVIQVSLNRISQNYPAIPKIRPVNGIYDEKTQEAVREFQRVFGLTPDGIVGRATWYKLVALFVGVTQLGELVSSGQQYRRVGFQYPGVLREGMSGEGVRVLQYMLAVLAEFDPALRQITIDGIFGSSTRLAVIAYQRKMGLVPDGVVGEQTWNALYRSYIGIGNYLNRDRVRFRGETVPAMSGGAQGSYAESARLGQDPGIDLNHGDASGKEKGVVLV